MTSAEATPESLADYQLPAEVSDALQQREIRTNALIRTVTLRCIGCFARCGGQVSVGDVVACTQLERSSVGHIIGKLREEGALVNPYMAPGPADNCAPRLYYEVAPPVAAILRAVPPLSICSNRR